MEWNEELENEILKASQADFDDELNNYQKTTHNATDAIGKNMSENLAEVQEDYAQNKRETAAQKQHGLDEKTDFSIMQAASGDLDDIQNDDVVLTQEPQFVDDTNSVPFTQEEQPIVDTNDDSRKQSTVNKRKTILIVSSIAAVFVVVLSVFLVGKLIDAPKGKHDTTGTSALQNAVNSGDEIAVINAVNAGFKEIEQSYSLDGRVPIEKTQELLEEETQYALSLVQSGFAVSATQEETGCVRLELKQGDIILYAPDYDGLLSGQGNTEILTFEPFVEHLTNRLGFNFVDDNAKKVTKKNSIYHFDSQNNVDEQIITIDSLMKLKNKAIILWFGHGDYTKEDHALLALSIKYNDIRNKYQSDCLSGAIVNRNGYVCISSKFFDTKFSKGDFQDSLIVLNACHSLQDSVLSDVFINRIGAKAVVGTSYKTACKFAEKMNNVLFDNLLENKTLEQSLHAAQEKVGENDRKYKENLLEALFGLRTNLKSITGAVEALFHPSKYVIHGDGAYKLSTKKKTNSSTSFEKKLMSDSWEVLDYTAMDGSLQLSFKKNRKVKMSSDWGPKEIVNESKYTIKDNAVIFQDEHGDTFRISNIDSSDLIQYEYLDTGFACLAVKVSKLTHDGYSALIKNLDQTVWHSRNLENTGIKSIAFTQTSDSINSWLSEGENSNWNYVGWGFTNSLIMYRTQTEGQNQIPKAFFVEKTSDSSVLNVYSFYLAPQSGESIYTFERWNRVN